MSEVEQLHGRWHDQSRAVIRVYGRAEYVSRIAGYPIELPLKPDQLDLDFRRWDEAVGSKAGGASRR